MNVAPKQARRMRSNGLLSRQWQHFMAATMRWSASITAASSPQNIPLQLVQANPATGNGAMTDVTYIQRLNTVGGVAPSAPCGKPNAGARQQVKYQADYVFYKK